MRLSVYACRGEHVTVLFTKKETAGLAGYVADGVLTEEGIEQCVTVLKAFQESLLGIRIDGFSVFALCDGFSAECAQYGRYSAHDCPPHRHRG